MNTSELRRRVEALCSDACAGRDAGSAEGAAARAFIEDELRQSQLEPTTQPVPGCHGANVFANVPGDRPRKTIVVGAHYDHIGRALSPDAYWGADDNAAAVAMVLGLADSLAARPAAGPVLLCAFDGEEPPHFLTDAMGSMRFCQQPPVPLDQIDLAIVLDLVGHANGPVEAPAAIRQSLFVLGAEKSSGTEALVTSCEPTALALRSLDLDCVPPLSDYEPFRRAGVPVLFLTCGRWRHYHETTDTPDRLDYGKITHIGAFLEDLVRTAASATDHRGRYQPAAKARHKSVETLIDMTRALGPLSPTAAAAHQVLTEISTKAAIDDDDWAIALHTLAQLERGLRELQCSDRPDSSQSADK